MAVLFAPNETSSQALIKARLHSGQVLLSSSSILYFHISSGLHGGIPKPNALRLKKPQPLRREGPVQIG